MAGRRSFVMGVIGHVDHGKTALVRGLTGMETDRLPEERRRGISIALGFAHLAAGGAIVDLIDMPGHERFVRTMIGGATGIDAVLLVVAANEGIKPQTVEHVEIAGILGLRAAVIAVTKLDLVSRSEAEAAGTEAAELARRCGLAGPAPVLTSAVSGAGLKELAGAISEIAGRQVERGDDGFPYLPVDRAFSVAGHGTVVTGTLRRGRISSGDSIALLPDGREARVRRLQVHGSTADTAEPGQRVAVNLRGIEVGEVGRGIALATPGLLEPSAWIAARIRATPSAPVLQNGQKLKLLSGTAETDAVLRLLDRDELDASDTALVQLRCAERLALPVREPVVLRLASPPRTVAGGRVLETTPRRLRRRDGAALARLDLLANESPATILRAELRRAGAKGARVLSLARVAGLSVAAAERELGRLGERVVGGTAVGAAALARISETVMRVVAAQRDGVKREAFRSVAGPVLELAVTTLAPRGVVLRDGLIRRLRVEDERERAANMEAAAKQMAADYRAAGLSPPADPAGPDARRIRDSLIRAGVLVRTYDRAQKREIVFHGDAVETARRLLTPLLDGAGMTVSEIGAVLGISRKYSVPLLEYLDAIQFTRRVGDRRLLRERRDLSNAGG